MATSGKSGQSASFRLKLNYGDVEAFVQKFSRNISPAGIFLPSKKPKAKGTTLRFELLLADGETRVFKGSGNVEWVRNFDPDHPRRPHGMGIRFDKLDAPSRKLMETIVVMRDSLGLDNDDDSLPEPRSVRLASEPVAASAVPRTRSAGNGRAAALAVGDVAGGSDVEALLGIDTATLNAALSRARAIAHRQLTSGGAGFDDLQQLLVPVTLPPIEARAANEGLAAALGVAPLSVPVRVVHNPVPKREAFPAVAPATQLDLNVEDVDFDDAELLDADAFDDAFDAVVDLPTRNVAAAGQTDALSDRFNEPLPRDDFNEITPLPPPPGRSSLEPLPMIPEASADVAAALDANMEFGTPEEFLPPPPGRSSLEPLPMIPEASADVAAALDADMEFGTPEELRDPDVPVMYESPWDGQEDQEDNTNVLTLSGDYDEVDMELDDMELLEIDEHDLLIDEDDPDDPDGGPKKGFLQRIFKK